MSKEHNCSIKGQATFSLPAKEAADFDEHRDDEGVVVILGVGGIGRIELFPLMPDDIISGNVVVTKFGAGKSSYKIEIDAVASVRALKPKDWELIDAGKAQCTFENIGYGYEEWYLGAKFEDGQAITMKST